MTICYPKFLKAIGVIYTKVCSGLGKFWNNRLIWTLVTLQIETLWKSKKN